MFRLEISQSMIVQRHYMEGVYADFNPATGEINRIKPLPLNPVKLGYFEYDIQEKFVCLVRKEDSLRIVVRHADLKSVTLDQRVSSSLDKSDASSTIHIHVDGKCKLELTIPNLPTFEDDPTAFIEPEDFDYALFLHGVINHEKVREQVYRATSPTD